MILEAVRIVADWLEDATYGVNALAASTPRDTGVTQAPDVFVFDSTRDGFVSRGQIPDTLAKLPALLVSPADSPLDQANPASRPFPPDASVTVLVRYAAASTTDTAKLERDASQTIRAVWRSLGQLFVTTAGETARSRASVQCISLRTMQASTLYEANQDVVVTGGVLLTVHVRDLWAQS